MTTASQPGACVTEASVTGADDLAADTLSADLISAGGRQSARPLRVLVLVSATGANLSTLLMLAKARPDLIDVALVASDRPAARALDVAEAAGIATWPGTFLAEVGRASDCRTDAERLAYADRARAFHDRLCERIEQHEHDHGEFDLVVLAYHRWIHGRLLDKFAGRMINQHPGDLASLDESGRRTLIGNDPVGVALRRGDTSTQTSTFFVDDTPDGGAIIARGPAVEYRGPWPPTTADVSAHELTQKLHSDRPALIFAVRAIAEGRVALDPARRHLDGSSVVLLDGVPIPFGGVDLPVAGSADR
jgi:phosphoribosylglycinamide formyltransferase-1